VKGALNIIWQKDYPMTTRAVHCKIDEFDIYIGRGSIWGNPFSSKKGTKAKFIVEDRETSIECYREWLLTQHYLLAQISSLKGKRLGCFCKLPHDPNRPCHGDILAEFAENPPQGIKTIYDGLEDL